MKMQFILRSPFRPPYLPLARLRAEAKVCRLKLMQLYCYRCLWSAYFVSLMKYSMWKFSQFFVVPRRQKEKSTKHAKSNFASETIFCSPKSTSERQWHVKLFTRNNSYELKAKHKNFFFCEYLEKREKKTINYILLLLHFIWSRISPT